MARPFPSPDSSAAPADAVATPTTGRDFVTRQVEAAAAKLPRFFPLDAFVASNPLHGFEHLPFETALGEARRAFGGRGHRPLRTYRDALAAGELEANHLDAALANAAGNGTLSLAGKAFPERALARHIVHHGLTAPDAPELIDAAATAIAAAGLEPAAPTGAFDPAAETFLAWLDRHLGTDLSVRAAERTIALAESCLIGAGAATRGKGPRTLFEAFRAELDSDPMFRALVKHADLTADDLAPAPTETAVLGALYALAIPRDARGAYIERQLFDLKGWAAFVHWYETHAGTDRIQAALLDFLAVRLTLERMLWHDLALELGLEPEPATLQRFVRCDAPPGVPARDAAALAAVGAWLAVSAETLAHDATADEIEALLTSIERYDDLWVGMRFLEASERQYRVGLDAALIEGAAAASSPSRESSRPEAQFVFCIDVRSEPFRRALEGQGRLETFGYAGFFGLPVAYQGLDGKTTARCPALIQPGHAMYEAFATHLSDDERRRVERDFDHDRLRREAVANARQHPLAGLGLVDGFGILSLVPLLKDALGLRKAAAAPHDALTPALDHDGAHGLAALSFEERVAIARNLFDLTGLSAPFAPLIFLTGHGSTTENNPFASALDCGACGGHEGAPNARALARILNDPKVRDALVSFGIAVPSDTVFVPAQHDTTTDDVTLFDLSLVPSTHTARLPAIRRMLENAGRENRRRRAPALKVVDPDADLRRRALDSAAVRPEWGLAGNAAFVIAPREVTRHLDLEGRAFLHSYDWRTDEDGAALTTIVTAPMVVTQWINAQYYFSTADNATWGSGSKVTQNVVGCAVMQGELSDLRLGLPYQSVFDETGRAVHEPLRLMVVVQTPVARLERILAEQPDVKRLFDNEWLALEVLDPEVRWLLAYRPHAGFERVRPFPDDVALPAAS